MTLLITDKLHINYSIPSFDGAHSNKYILLTVGGVLVTGPWRGYLGEFYRGWAPLLKGSRNCNLYLASLPPAALAKIGRVEATPNGVTVTYLDGHKCEIPTPI